MRTHLTWEEIEKYLDTADETEEYLLWMEKVSHHIETCELCEKRIQKALITETMLQEENLGKMLKLAQQEEDIRRNILICKLYQMSLEKKIDEEWKENLMNIMNGIQKQSLNPYVFHVAAMQRKASVTRGEENVPVPKEEKIEIRYDKNCLQIWDKKEPEKKFMAVLNHAEKKPQIAKALWAEERECFVAEFEVGEQEKDFEIYIIP